MYVICHVTSHYHLIERSCDFMGENSLCYVNLLIPHKQCDDGDVFSLSRDLL